MDTVFAFAEEKMNKRIDTLHRAYDTIRTGRATPAVLDHIMVDYYGVPTPINQLATVSVAEARVLTIQPWDTAVVNAIDKAIQASDIGINPQNDGRMIRLSFPQLTEEHRKEITKTIGKEAEEAKIGIRNVRRDAIEKLKKMKKDSVITEDDLKIGENELQKITDKFVKQIDEIAAKKDKEIMAI